MIPIAAITAGKNRGVTARRMAITFSWLIMFPNSLTARARVRENSPIM